MMQTFGAKIRDARVARGMTQEGLAAALNVSRSTVSSWERDRTQPDPEMLRQMSGLLGRDFLQHGESPEVTPSEDAAIPEAQLLRPASKFPVKTFRQATENVPGQAFVEFENTRQEQTIGENVYSIYDFKLCERNGVGFDIVSAEITMEGKGGALRVMTVTGEDLQAAGMASRVEPGGTTAINGGWPKGEFKRVGIAARILDDAGAAQTYYSMIEF